MVTSLAPFTPLLYDYKGHKVALFNFQYFWDTESNWFQTSEYVIWYSINTLYKYWNERKKVSTFWFS